MKRIRSLLPALILLAAVLCACSGQEKPAAYTVADGRALLESGAFDGAMEPVDSYVLSMLYGVDEEKITECICCLAIDTSVSADELTVLVMADEQSAQAAEEACRQRVAWQMESCASYCPDQVPRLEDAVILRRGNTVLLAVGNPEKLSRALDELGLN